MVTIPTAARLLLLRHALRPLLRSLCCWSGEAGSATRGTVLGSFASDCFKQCASLPLSITPDVKPPVLLKCSCRVRCPP